MTNSVVLFQYNCSQKQDMNHNVYIVGYLSYDSSIVFYQKVFSSAPSNLITTETQ